MKKILPVWIFLLPILGLAQKIETDKIDDFTGERSISTTSEQIKGKNILSPNYVSVQVVLFITKIEKKQDTSMVIYFSFTTPTVASTDKDNSIFIKLENNTIVKLKNRGGYNIESSGGILSMYSVLEPDDIAKLKSSGVAKIRFENSSADIDVEIDEKKRQVIKNCVQLISEYKL